MAKHKCSDKCVCPACGKNLLYSPRLDDHACPDIQCEFAHGGL